MVPASITMDAAAANVQQQPPPVVAAAAAAVPADPMSGADDIELEVGTSGWRKRITRRKGGASEGHLDVYVTPPFAISGSSKRLRSTEDLIKFLADRPHAADTVEPDCVNFQKTFRMDQDSQPKAKLVAALEHIKSHVGADGRADMSGFQFAAKYKAKKKATLKRSAPPGAQKHKRPLLNGGAAARRRFSDKEQTYLSRQHSKVPFPNADQMFLMAASLRGAEVADVARWFRRKNGLENEADRMLAGEEEEEEEEQQGSPGKRPPRRFDVLDAPGVSRLEELHEEEEDCVVVVEREEEEGEPSVVWDNAELDEEAEWFARRGSEEVQEKEEEVVIVGDDDGVELVLECEETSQPSNSQAAAITS